jgi:hypothetical protein
MQVFWTYEDDFQQSYSVGLYHGDNSGHVLVYCGKEIIKIDFHVHLPQTYSFYLGNELFELKIHFDGDRRSYRLWNLNRDTEIVADHKPKGLLALTEKEKVVLFLIFVLMAAVFLIKLVFF